MLCRNLLCTTNIQAGLKTPDWVQLENASAQNKCDIQAADNSSCMQDDGLMHIPCCPAIKNIAFDVHFICLHLPTISRCLQFRG